MKPCDCRSLNDVDTLEEQGLAFNSKKIAVDSTGVLLIIDPYVRIKIDHKNFKRFAKWYLEDQHLTPNTADCPDKTCIYLGRTGNCFIHTGQKCIEHR